MRKFATLTAAAAAVGLFGVTSGTANASHCTVGLGLPVTAPASIQAAVDAAVFGDVVCLDDSGGDFAQTVVFGSEDSGITLSPDDGDTPGLDGSATAFAEAIRLLDGVTDVTIEGLNIHHYTGAFCCGVGNAVQAWAVNTSNITIQNNNMHDNNYSAILVGSEGAQTHSGWRVHRNIVKDNATSFFSAQIELTNCNGCSIHRNTVDGGAIGILVQGRNTVSGSGLVEIKGVSVKRNTVIGSPSFGVFILALASDPTPPFDPILAAQTELRDVSLGGNSITSGLGAVVWGLEDGDVINPALVRNEFLCSAGGIGIFLVDQIDNAKVVNNDINNGTATCGFVDGGDETKFPPVPDNPSIPD